MLTPLLPQLPAGQYHKVHTVSLEPSCYMYLYVNTTALELEQNLTRLRDLRERVRNGTGEGGGTPNTQHLTPWVALGDPKSSITSAPGEQSAEKIMEIAVTGVGGHSRAPKFVTSFSGEQ